MSRVLGPADFQVCRTCGRALRLRCFYRDRANRRQRKSQCIECSVAYGRGYAVGLKRGLEINLEEVAAANPVAWTCTRCGEEKPIGEFYEREGMQSGHYHQCKACLIGQAMAGYRRRREKSFSGNGVYPGKSKSSL